jgi:hypothetical protein
MKKNILFTFVLTTALAFILPVGARASKTMKGWIQGYNCVVHGHRCSIDKMDPHLMLEPDFALILNDGSYWLMPNIARHVKAKFVHNAIRVTGDLNSKYNSIEVDKLEVKKNGSYATVWSKEMMRREMENRQEEYYGVEH